MPLGHSGKPGVYQWFARIMTSALIRGTFGDERARPTGEQGTLQPARGHRWGLRLALRLPVLGECVEDGFEDAHFACFLSHNVLIFPNLFRLSSSTTIVGYSTNHVTPMVLG